MWEQSPHYQPYSLIYSGSFRNNLNKGSIVRVSSDYLSVSSFVDKALLINNLDNSICLLMTGSNFV